MKNIFITDLDHTFLKTDLTISEYTKDIWNKKSLDNIMSVATARTYKKTMQFLKNIQINAPMILLDGSLIATVDKKIIDTKFIDKESGDAIIDEGAKFGIYPFILSLSDKNLNEAFIYPSICNAHQRELLTRYTKDDNLQEQKNIRAMRDNFKIVYMGEEKLLRKLLVELRRVFKNELKYILAPEAYIGCYFLTILHKDADKAHGIKSVCEYKNLDMDKLTVFGDNLNDLGMFQLAKTSIAVANSHEKLKKYATIVSKYSNDEDAVAKYLEGIK
jgi:Cof subfamily protein (haloacid dehalogenase superfamily)